MKKFLVWTVIAALTAFSVSAAEWGTDYSKIVKESRDGGKPILMLFTGSDWCPACKYLESNVLKDKSFDGAVAGKVLLLYLDFPRGKEQSAELKAQNAKLAREYKVKGFPTLLIVDGEGKVLATQVGAFMTFKDFSAWLDKGLKTPAK